jgi:hypothetical protein
MVCSPPEARIILYKTPRPVCGPIGLILYLNRWSLPGFRATEVMQVRTPAAGLKPNNLRIVSFPLYLHLVRGYLVFTLIPRIRLKFSKFSY